MSKYKSDNNSRKKLGCIQKSDFVCIFKVEKIGNLEISSYHVSEMGNFTEKKTSVEIHSMIP